VNGGPQPSAQAVLSRTGALVRPALEEAANRLEPELREPVLHQLGGGGKGVRAGLAVVGAAAAGGSEQDGVLGA
jgi:geranylgeranyl diphosphate synthase type I